MEELLQPYGVPSTALFVNGSNLRSITAQFPNEPGVYLWYSISANNEKLLCYIGKAGTFQNGRGFKNQKLRGRLNASRGMLTTQEFLQSQLISNRLPAIEISGYVTWNEQIHHLPGYVEALLLNRYLSLYNDLPKWNLCF